MAVPKRRWSKQRTRTQRSTWKLGKPNMVKCKQCGEPAMPHRVCNDCGYYGGKEVIAQKEA
ncbi:MAG: 50S ribosomal protein L32 [Oscillospiraceae bacterium]|nr:50S ribosomal protein L32 [Oscillospiraceae bacterium]